MSGNEIAVFNNLTVAYGKVIALNNINLKIEGDSILIIGPNGSGKSTLVKTMIGLIRPRRGAVKTLGLDPLKERRKLYSKITYMGEKDGIPYNIKVNAHLNYLEYHYGKRVWKIADLLNLTSHLNKRYSELSRGLQRRLALVEPLSSNREMIILDDPFLGLDIEGRSLLGEILEDIRRMNEQKIIVVTHMMIPGFNASKLVVLDSGSLTYYGGFDLNIIKSKIVSC